MSPTTARLRSALIALPLAAAGLLGGVTPAGAAPVTPVTSTTPVTCQGQGIDPAAMHYRAETLVRAPLSTVWRLQTDVAKWPAWQDPVTSARRLDPGPLRAGSRFRWTTPVPAVPPIPATTLVITSTVHQLDRGHCVRWSGPAIGTGLRIDRGTHVWTFRPAPGGVLVTTEESWTGAQVEALPDLALGYLSAGLDAWLAALKTTAEAHPGC